MASRPAVRGLAVANALVFAAGILGVFLVGGDGVPAAGARVTVDGRATVVRVDGDTDALTTGDIVRAGEEVRAEEGTFALELAGGGTVEGRAGFERAADTRVVVGERPELVAGEALLLGEDGVALDAAGTVVALTDEDAAARVDRGLSLRAGSYRGAVAIDSAGQERSVEALRQLGIASVGRPPGSAEPFLVDETDPWDRRFLGAAIDLGGRLDGYSRSFSDNAGPGAATSSDLFEEALPALADEPGFAAALRSEARRPPGETLVGAALVTLGTDGDFDDRWADVFGFRDDGAGWGLVAADQHLDDATVLATVEQALVRAQPTPEIAVGTTATTAGGGPGTTTGTGGTTPATTPPTTTDDSDDDGGGPSPTTPTTTPLPTTLPPLTTPPTTTVTTPPISTPEVTTPPVSTPILTIPPLTIPSITVPPTTLPIPLN